MKKLAILTILLSGCASLRTDQTDSTIDPATGKVTNVTRTVVSAYNCFQARTELSRLAVTSSAKAQSSKVGSLSQDANSTNAVNLIEAFAKLAGALPK